MTVTKRGSGYALNGDVHELTETLGLLESYIEHDAQWAHNTRRKPAMMAQAAKYRVLRERLTSLSAGDGVEGMTIVTNDGDPDAILSFVTCAAERCENQVDRPEDRRYCRLCEENYCLGHAEPKAHNCPRMA